MKLGMYSVGGGTIYIYYEIVHKVHNKKKMKKRQGKNKKYFYEAEF